jgi:hypothetical protein
MNESPRIAYAGADSIVIAYVNDANAGATFRRMRVAVTVDAGVVWHLTDPIIDGGGGEAVDPAIARVDGAGITTGAVIAWVDFRSGTRVNGDIYRVRVGR